MKFNIATNPFFMQAACGKGAKDVIELKASSANPTIPSITTTGAFKVITTYNGAEHTVPYANKATARSLVIQADANTTIKIVGDVTAMDLTNLATVTDLDLTSASHLATLTLTGATGLTTIKTHATVQAIADSVAAAITAATATDGTVYLNSTETYYSTVNTAATTKGWTVASL